MQPEHKPEYKPLISVVIPCHSLAHFLPEAVHSVLKHQGDAVECIIVNDDSPDNTAEVAHELQQIYGESVVIITHESNQFLAGSLNSGLYAAKGKYVLNLDADNMLPPHSLAMLSSYLDAYREVDIVYGGISIVEENGKTWTPKDWPPDTFDYNKFCFEHFNPIHSSAMFRRRIGLRIGGYRKRARTGEDASFWLLATSLGAVPRKITQEPTLIYRNRKDSMSHTTKDWDWTCWVPKHQWAPGAALHVGLPVAARSRDKDDSRSWPMISNCDPIKVSVIIPVGPGHEETVLDALDSLWIQTLSGWEAIVVNDTGHSLSRIPSFARVVSTDGDVGRKGAGASRNLGIQEAKGETVLFLDADDFLEPVALEVMYDCWKTGGAGGYVYCDWVELETGTFHQTMEHDCAELLNGIWHPSSMMLSTVIAQETLFDTDISWEDWDYTLRLAAAGVYGTRVPVALLHVRSGSGRRIKAEFESLDALKAVVRHRWGNETMACGSCGGRRYTPPSNMITSRTAARPANIAGNVVVGTQQQMPRKMVLLGYAGRTFPTMNGKSTGIVYYFGADASHRVKSVYAEDAPTFLSHADFHLVEGELTGHEALGMEAFKAILGEGIPRATPTLR